MSQSSGGSGEKSFGQKAAESDALGAIGAVSGAVALGVLGFLLGGPARSSGRRSVACWAVAAGQPAAAWRETWRRTSRRG